MKKLLALLLCSLLALTVSAEDVSAELKQLEKEMYQYYHSKDFPNFQRVTERLKELSLASGNERLFYKAWGNQAILAFTTLSRQEGLAIAKEIRDYAEQHNSKFGLYSSTYATGTMLSALKMFSDAERSFQEAINYQHQYFPDESAAAPYLAMAKIEVNRKDYKKVYECAQKALQEPGVIPQHKLAAWSFTCISLLDGDKEQFNAAYAERQKVKQELGHDDNLGNTVEFYHAEINGDYERSLEIAKTHKSALDRMNLMARAYANLGRYDEAYNLSKKSRELSDSVNTVEVRMQSAEFAVQLDLARTESEAKDLRLANQALKLAHVTDELEQQRLEEEALNLTLKNRDMELSNAAVRLRNDSLESHNKDLQLREYQLQMQNQSESERANHVIMLLGVLIAAITIVFMGFYAYRRRQQMLKLRQAYEQLEETTTAKERIESELRIAREIQTDMVPSRFPAYPDRPDLDLYASLTTAREVGGDLYDFFLQDEKFYFCVGDVSGKGVPAAMLMSVAVNLFRAIGKDGVPPSYIATRLNEMLAADNENGMFVTMFIGVVDLRTGRLDFCNAGHNPPVVVGGDECRFLEMESNAPLGLWPGLRFEEEHVDNLRNKMFFVYTDGLNEAENATQEQFGEERLLSLLKTHPYGDARRTVEMFMSELRTYVGGVEQSDDLTMLCFRLR